MSRILLLLAFAGCNGDTEKPIGDKVVDTDIPPTGDTDTTPVDTDTEPPLPDACDAGTEAWVQRVFPLVLGRKVHGAHEVRMWAAVADRDGRDVAVRALSRLPTYDRWWKMFFTDALYVARTGDKEYGSCFQAPKLDVHDGSLAQFLRSNDPKVQGGFGSDFNMADVVLDSLEADDLAPIYQAHLFARMNKPTTGANVSEEELEYNRRVNFGSLFLDTYTNRNLVCITCHNSEYSLTPDRTYGAPGLWEKALFGQSFGTPTVDEVYGVFKYHDVVEDGGGKRPWGMNSSCGTFSTNVPADDYLDQETTFFIQAYDASSSVWEVERALADGANAIAGVGPTVNADLSVDGNQALAWLVAENIVDQVWEYGMGKRLTIAYSFSRNQAQADRHVALTNTFVQSGWSLRELLVGIATDPYFNAGLPATCESELYGMDAVIDPYTVDADPSQAGNGPGDVAHRHTARSLMTSLHDAMEWPMPEEYFGGFVPDQDALDFQGAIGVFLRESEPGFNGTDFQGLLAWEDEYVTCRNRDKLDDHLVALYVAAVEQDLTVEELVLALKDRLVAQGDLETDERPLVESLLGMPLTSKVADADPVVLQRNLGLLCGAVVMSPDFFLAVEPRPIGPTPTLALGYDADCTALIDAMAEEGITTTCEETATARQARR